MKKIIFSITAIAWSVIQSNAQVGALPPTPPTPSTLSSTLSTPAVPPVEAYSNSTSKSITRSSVTTRHKTTKDGKTEVYTESYTTSGLQEGQYDDAQRSKTFSKSYNISKSDKINISNIYGSITVKTWDKNEVKLDADIKAYANSEEEAQKLIDNVSIANSKNGDEVVFKTQMEDRNGSWGNGSRNGKRWRREVKIHMTVYMPASNPLTALQQYGNLNMDDYNGPTSLKVQYGNLTTGNLNNTNNYIAVQYGKAVLKDVKEAKIKVQYGSGLTIAEIDEVELEAQYTSVNIATVKRNANIKHQYGSGVTIGYAGSLNLTAQYTNIKLGKLAGTFTGKIQYGKLNIDQVEAAAKTVNVDADYTTVSLGFASGYGADFNVNTSYGSFRYGDNVTARKAGDDNKRGYSSTKEYSGTIGKGGSSIVRVNAKYGGVTFR